MSQLKLIINSPVLNFRWKQEVLLKMCHVIDATILYSYYHQRVTSLFSVGQLYNSLANKVIGFDLLDLDWPGLDWWGCPNQTSKSHQYIHTEHCYLNTSNAKAQQYIRTCHSTTTEYLMSYFSVLILETSQKSSIVFILSHSLGIS